MATLVAPLVDQCSALLPPEVMLVELASKEMIEGTFVVSASVCSAAMALKAPKTARQTRDVTITVRCQVRIDFENRACVPEK